jgi:tetratricopeptide (TPR) repeat protein
MSESAVRTVGLAASVCYAALIVWVYAHQPQSLAEVRGGLSSSIGAYQIDQPAFDEGLRLFRNGQFEAARAAFDRADAAHKDARTQFYIAYSFYREGWGRFYDDTRLFAQGVDAVDRAIALAPHGNFREDDPDLMMHTADELRAELEAGLRTASPDLNPLAVFRTRK